jgi:hypothetical protein
MFKLFADKHSPYKECCSCTLPYIDNVNGRNGFCDFCADGKNATPSTLAASPAIGIHRRNSPIRPAGGGYALGTNSRKRRAVVVS